MPQFMRGDVILIIEHMFAKQVSYKAGVIKLKNIVNDEKAGDILGNCTIEEFTKSLDSDSSNLTSPMSTLMKMVTTTCQALGQTKEAAQAAGQCHFASMDHFGPYSLFLTILPCNECSFCVCLFAQPNRQVQATNIVASFCRYFVLSLT